LGFSFSDNKESKRRVAPKAVLRCKQKIRELTRRTRGISLDQMLKELTAYLRGWKGYFGFCQTPSLCSDWINGYAIAYGPRSGSNGNAGSSGTGGYVNAESVRYSLPKQRVVRTVPGGWRTARPYHSRFRSPASTLSVFPDCLTATRNPLNRPMRTRMSVVWQG
jgi:hypothetical protein